MKNNWIARPAGRLSATAIALAIVVVATNTAAAAAKPVKVFILAGQSNMEGKAKVSLLDYQAKQPDTRDLFKHLRNGDKWAERDDVWIKFLDRKGKLTVGFGSPGCIGPELEFGAAVGDYYGEQVLLIKTAWGGRSLYRDFRPPSAGLPPADVLEKALAELRKKKADATIDDVKKPYGESYRAMIDEVNGTLAKLQSHFPDYAGQGYEMAGFVWFQGWNDMINADYTKEYAANLAHLIRDVRKDLKAPRLPFVTGQMGVDGDSPGANIRGFKTAQAANVELAEFKGNVSLVKTDRFWDKEAELVFKKGWREHLDEWNKVGSDYPYHYLGSAKTMLRIGRAFGDAMLELRGDMPSYPIHMKVYAEPGRFGGWPANHGIWAWGDEILVGFSAGHSKDNGPERHAIDHDKPEEHLLARSKDGGKSWSIENPAEKGALIPTGRALHGITPPGLKEKPWQDCPGGIDFTDPNFALTARMTDVNAGPSRFSCSTDRGKTWQGPFRLPLFDRKGIAARTDYIVNGKHDCLLFLTAAKEDGKEGRPLCVRTTDGGKNWQFVSWIGPEPRGYAIMPSTVRLGASELLTAIRCRDGAKSWIESYRSNDNGQNWKLDGSPVPDTGAGNPASMIRLKDGRVCLTYGHRAAPFSIRARLSGDGGRTWDKEIILRDGGGGRDLGYPRTVQRPDGKIVTVYYFHDQPKG